MKDNRKIAGGSAVTAGNSIKWLHKQIRESTPNHENALLLLNRVVAQGRFYIGTREQVWSIHKSKNAFPSGVLRYDNATYFPNVISPEQRMLEIALLQFLSIVKAGERKKREEDMAAYLRLGDTDLERLRDGVPGIYAVYLPEKRNASGEILLYPGAALVSVGKKFLGPKGRMDIIRVISGLGKLAWLNEHTNRWISVSSFRRDASDINLSGELLEFSNRLIGTLRVAYKQQHPKIRACG